MSAPDPVDRFFAGLEERESPEEHYPGSRRKRRKMVAPPPPTARDTSGWDKNGYVKIVGGRRMEFYPIGALAKAINRSTNTVRNWIRLGYIPHAPYRLPGYEVDGKTVPGPRLWTRDMVLALVELLARYDLLDSRRLEWGNYPDLPGEIQRAWEEIYTQVLTAEESDNTKENNHAGQKGA